MIRAHSTKCRLNGCCIAYNNGRRWVGLMLFYFPVYSDDGTVAFGGQSTDRYLPTVLRKMLPDMEDTANNDGYLRQTLRNANKISYCEVIHNT